MWTHLIAAASFGKCPRPRTEARQTVYRTLGVRLVYHPDEQKIRVEINLNPDCVVTPIPSYSRNRFVSEGGLEPPCPVKGTSTSS